VVTAGVRRRCETEEGSNAARQRRGIPPRRSVLEEQVTLLRLVLGALTLVTVVRVKRLRLPSGRAVWMHFTVAALVANALPYWLFAYGEQHVPSSVAGAINATTPLWTVVVALALRAESRPSAIRVVGLATGFLGAIILVAPWDTGSTPSLGGALACLAASASYGLSHAYMARYLAPRTLPPLVLAAGQLTAASALLLLVTPVAGLQPIRSSPSALLSLAVLGFIGTGIAYVLNYRIITDDGPSVASTVTYLLPIVSIGLGRALDEPATGQLLAGTVVVLAGVALVRQDRRSATAKRGEIIVKP
jgi:drug/metabolite transporter (DMT)-like permease